jgi:hypothetical protein
VNWKRRVGGLLVGIALACMIVAAATTYTLLRR